MGTETQPAPRPTTDQIEAILNEYIEADDQSPMLWGTGRAAAKIAELFNTSPLWEGEAWKLGDVDPELLGISEHDVVQIVAAPTEDEDDTDA